jgi:hypothetical protein
MTAVIVDLAAYRAARTGAAAPSDEVPLDEAIAICLARREILTPWEKRFLASIRHPNRVLSTKQQTVMQQIFDKVWGAAEEDDAS